jgi:hypothetical protein
MGMRYDIGEYGLTRDKIVCWACFDGTPIHYLWYVDDSAKDGFNTYDEAVDAIKEKMRADKETGRQDECLAEEDGHIIIYFTAGWDDHNCCILKMHISDSYPEDILEMIREYDDRIIIESV